MSILIVRVGIQGPRGLSGLAARETLTVAANIEAVVNVSDNMEELLTLPTEAENVTYNHTVSGLTAINVKDAIDELAALVVYTAPIGTVLDYAGASAPSNYLLCFGQAVSRSTYAGLFAILGTLYGVGDGSTTFNIPDARDRATAGKGDMGGTAANRLTGALSGGVTGTTLGGTGGKESHTLTEAQMPAHNHTFSIPRGGNSDNDDTKVARGDGAVRNPIGGNTSSAGSGAAHNNVQPTLILNKIIRYA